MTEQQINSNEKQAQPTRTHKRSPYLFPAYDFGLARQIAEKVERDGAGSLSEETLAIALRLSVKSSGFQLKALASRQFGLITKQGPMLTTTPLAKAIFKPINEAEKKNALIESFMAIPLFREVATRFKGRPLPQGQDFRNILERELGIDSRRVSDAERVLTDSARETGVMVNSGGSIYLSTERSTTVKEEKPREGEQPDPDSDSGNDEERGQPSLNIQIDSKDFTSMEPDNIKAFFDGLSQIINKEEKNKE